MRFPSAQEAWVRTRRDDERTEWRRVAQQSRRKLVSWERRESIFGIKYTEHCRGLQIHATCTHLSEAFVEDKHS